jgi:hypothetical protein
MAVVAKTLVKGYQVVKTVKNYFVAAALAGLLGGVLNQECPDALLLRVAMDGHIFDVTYPTAAVDELLLEQKRGCSNNPIVEDGHERANPESQTVAEDLASLSQRQANIGQAGE